MTHRLTRRLFQEGGAYAYVRESIVITQVEHRAQVRDEVLRVGFAAAAAWPDQAMRKTISRYPAVIGDTIGGCYLIAYSEEWEDLDRDRLVGLLERAAHDYREAEDSLDFVFLATLGLATDSRHFHDARELVKSHPSIERMGHALRSMFDHVLALPIKRRHREDYERASVGAIEIGIALGLLDHSGVIRETPVNTPD